MEHPKHLLGRHGLMAKKSLGQNFLYDDQILARIAGALELQADDQVLEVGPGLGSLTRHLARQAGRIVAVEIDERLIPLLIKEFSQARHVEVLQSDILEVDPARWFAGRYKAVGNVPYYITGAILRHLLSAANPPEMTVLTVQKEVADRIAAQPGEMSMLSVSVQFYTQVERLFVIKAGAFWPKPEVDSTVVRLTERPMALVAPDEQEAFFNLVKVGFAQKRKQLQKNLRALGLPRARLAAAFARAGIEGRRRAQSLSLDEWCALHNALS
jgi:16S rRNA (adenine1518-N6/adenine1519-N6)-dimethyltransferase